VMSRLRSKKFKFALTAHICKVALTCLTPLWRNDEAQGSESDSLINVDRPEMLYELMAVNIDSRLGLSPGEPLVRNRQQVEAI